VFCFLILDLFCLGVDFKVKYLTIGEKKLKLAIWDTGERSILLLLLFGIYVNVTHLVVLI